MKTLLLAAVALTGLSLGLPLDPALSAGCCGGKAGMCGKDAAAMDMKTAPVTPKSAAAKSGGCCCDKMAMSDPASGKHEGMGHEGMNHEGMGHKDMPGHDGSKATPKP